MECASERYERSGPFTGNRAWLFGAALFGLAGIGPMPMFEYWLTAGRSRC